MEILKNQTIYKCSFCGRRLLSRNGCRLHESEYCKAYDSPNNVAFRNKQEECEHGNIDTEWSYIPGEAVKEPHHDFCIDCGKVL